MISCILPNINSNINLIIIIIIYIIDLFGVTITRNITSDESGAEINGHEEVHYTPQRFKLVSQSDPTECHSQDTLFCLIWSNVNEH